MRIPRDRKIDNTFPLLFSEGYEYISNRCRRYGTDIFSTRILLQRAFCTRGEEAAEQFYFPGRFTRRGALPLFAVTLIQNLGGDLGSVMMPDEEEHRGRKEMLLSLVTPEKLRHLAELTEFHWWARARGWQGTRSITLLHEAYVPLCAAICEWSGLRLKDHTIRRRAAEFEAMIEGTGSIGPRNWRGHMMRARTERWMRRVIHGIRKGQIRVPEGCAAQVISTFCDGSGKPMDVKSAAVELINVLRPTVANARYIVFAAMALYEHPEWRETISGSDKYLEAFVHEVRRFYPFIPFIGGRVIKEFTWRDRRFKRDDWVLFDLYGTNHDPRIWGDANVFRPERFLQQSFGPFDVVTHGAGDRHVTHRSSGEWITVEQMKAIVRLMACEMRYEVPPQDLHIDLARIPARPNSGFVVRNVRLEPQTFREAARAS
jgi:fatty-acid peroxygenase